MSGLRIVFLLDLWQEYHKSILLIGATLLKVRYVFVNVITRSVLFAEMITREKNLYNKNITTGWEGGRGGEELPPQRHLPHLILNYFFLSQWLIINKYF